MSPTTPKVKMTRSKSKVKTRAEKAKAKNIECLTSETVTNTLGIALGLAVIIGIGYCLSKSSAFEDVDIKLRESIKIRRSRSLLQTDPSSKRDPTRWSSKVENPSTATQQIDSQEARMKKLQFVKSIKIFEQNQTLGEAEAQIKKDFLHLLYKFGDRKSCNQKPSEQDKWKCLNKLQNNKRMIKQAFSKWNKMGRKLTNLCKLQNMPSGSDDTSGHKSVTLETNGE